MSEAQDIEALIDTAGKDSFTAHPMAKGDIDWLLSAAGQQQAGRVIRAVIETLQNLPEDPIVALVFTVVTVPNVAAQNDAGAMLDSQQKGAIFGIPSVALHAVEQLARGRKS